MKPTSCSSYSMDSKSLSNRLETIFKKASEISILCEIELCVIHYGPDGELKTWPKDIEKVRDLAFRYNAATKRKKSVDLYGFLKKKKKTKTNFNKKAKIGNVNVTESTCPIFDNYSPDQISQTIESLELNSSILLERLRFVEARKQKNTNLDHPASHQIHQDQAESLNPSSQFSLFVYNHGDAILSQIPLSESNQLTNYSEEYGLKNHLMKQELSCCDQNMCMGNNFQRPCVSMNTQESVDDYELNHLMQDGVYDYDQNMCIHSDSTNNNILSNTASDDFCSNFQEPYGYMVGNTSFLQDFPDMSSSYDESSLLETSLHTIPLFSDNSRFLSDTVSDFQDTYGYMICGNTSFSQDMSSSYDVQTSSLHNT